MSLYALGDLHLSFQADKSMDKFGRVWKNHERKIEKYVNKIIKPEDTLVLTGDHSWGRKLAECEEDLAFIERLPGRKVLLRGNHDMFWSANKTGRLNELFAGKLFFLQNNFIPSKDYALVGQKDIRSRGLFISIAGGRSWAGTKRGNSTRRNWYTGKRTASGSLSGRRKMPDTKSLSCFYITRPPISWRKALRLRIWRKSMAWRQWYTLTATARAASETVSGASTVA